MKEYELDRFVKAQQKHFDRALSEIKVGEKDSCWMWYIFPQLKELGKSKKAFFYGIADIEEAKAYLAKPVLRENLLAITQALLELEESDPTDVMGIIDDEKLRSSMTLFEIAAPHVTEFRLVLKKYFGGVRDHKTIAILEQQSSECSSKHE